MAIDWSKRHSAMYQTTGTAFMKKEVTKFKAKAAKAAIAKIAKAVVHRAAEDKMIAPQVIRNNRIFNILNDNVLQCVPLVPFIGQGDGQGERLGNRVTTRRAQLYFSAHVFQIDDASFTDAPKYIDIYLYKFKKSNETTDVELKNFLQFGSTSTEYDSLTLPESGGLNVNKDKFILKKHIRKTLWNPKPNNVATQAARNVMNACQFKLDITKYLKKKLLYDDEVSNVVTNDNLYISVVYTNNDDTTYSNATSVGEFDVAFMYKYEDL